VDFFSPFISVGDLEDYPTIVFDEVFDEKNILEEMWVLLFILMGGACCHKHSKSNFGV